MNHKLLGIVDQMGLEDTPIFYGKLIENMGVEFIIFGRI